MIMRLALIVVTAGLLSGAPAFASDTPATLIASTAAAIKESTLTAAQAQQLLNLTDELPNKARFNQRKYFKILPTPFESTGHYQYKANQFLWQTLTPIKSAFVIEQGTAFIVDATGNKVEQPQAQYFVQLLQAMITGDFNRLGQAFSFSASAQADCVDMSPLDHNIEQLFSAVTLCGQQRITQVSLFEATGNRTEIDFDYASDQ